MLNCFPPPPAGPSPCPSARPTWESGRQVSTSSSDQRDTGASRECEGQSPQPEITATCPKDYLKRHLNVSIHNVSVDVRVFVNLNLDQRENKAPTPDAPDEYQQAEVPGRTALTSMPCSWTAMRSFSLMDLCCVSVSCCDRDTFSSFRCSRRPAWVICPTFKEKIHEVESGQISRSSADWAIPEAKRGRVPTQRWPLGEPVPQDPTTHGLRPTLLSLTLTPGPPGLLCLRGAGRQS